MANIEENSNINKRFASTLDFISSESYNVLRTNLSFSIPGKQTGKIIGITSPNPKEGKSFTAVNLSYSIAKDGRKVLLISADLRLPSIEKLLQIPRGEGLSNLLAGNTEKTIDELIMHNILHEHMDLLIAGSIPPNPSELLGSKKMGELLERIKDNYEYVIIDLPPVNSVIDAVSVSPYIDGMVLLVRHGSTAKQSVVTAMNQLQFANVHILGFVYNDYHSGRGSKSYYYSKKYYKYKAYTNSNKDNGGKK